MLKRQYSSTARRSLNIIWSAADDYDFDPPFMAFFSNGKADLYFDMVVGLAKKWLDLEKITEFMDSLGTLPSSDEKRALLWLGLENCLYQKEIDFRPVLADLRKKRAEDFYKTNQSLSRQQMMMTSMKVFNQEEARWAKILGRRLPLMTPKEKKIAAALEFSKDLDSSSVIEEMTVFLERFFGYKRGKKTGRIELHDFRAKILSKIFRHERTMTDSLIIRSGSFSQENSVQISRSGDLKFASATEKDESWIRNLFGKNIYSEHEMQIMEESLCIKADLGCRLWICDSSRPFSGESIEARAIKNQAGKNRAFYHNHILLIKESIKKIAAQTDSILSSSQKHLPEKSKRGKIIASKAWRLSVLNDPAVFLSDGEETESLLEVDLLLDSSQSRMQIQEAICAQARIIAESFEKAKIPVRVLAFRSLRGFTVIQRLKDFASKNYDGIFNYFSGGWNRDSLCVKALDFLARQEAKSSGKERLLIVLTDASPNDSSPLILNSRKKEYEGAAAVEETAAAVKAMRTSGTKVSGIFFGSSLHLENAHRIFGDSFVRIQSVSQLAEGVRKLLTDFVGTMSQS